MKIEDLEKALNLNRSAMRFKNVIEARKNYSSTKPVAGVYAFIDDEERQIYFGSTNNLGKRFANHRSRCKTLHGCHPGLHSLFDLNGIENTPVEL